MLNIGAGEVIVIALILLIAVGPEQLPGLIRRVGRTVAEVRGMTEGLRSEFMSGLDEIDRATDPGAWAAAAGPSKTNPRTVIVPDDDDSADDGDDSADGDNDFADGENLDAAAPEIPDHSGLNSFLKPAEPQDDSPPTGDGSASAKTEDETEGAEVEESGGEE